LRKLVVATVKNKTSAAAVVVKSDNKLKLEQPTDGWQTLLQHRKTKDTKTKSIEHS